MEQYGERRKSQRLPIELQLEISKMFKQDYKVLDHINAKVLVCDISKTGLGFISTVQLPLYYYFNAKIKFSNNNYFFAVLKVIREKKLETGTYEYGAEFIGLAPFLVEKIEAYGRMILKEKCTTRDKVSIKC